MASFVVHYDRCDICNCFVAILFNLRIVKKSLNNKTMDTKQTAVEWLEIELKNWLEDAICLPDYIFEKAKQMEKEQIMYAYCKGVNEHDIHDEGHKINWEQYYNETYGKE
jgi:hypothetical protein